MKSRSNELLDRAKSAMVAAVEIYNKPGFPYRAESFSILAINGWELLLKARWLALHQNRQNCLYVYENRGSQGRKGTKKYIKRNRSGTPFTYDLLRLGRQLVNRGELNVAAWNNIEAMVEVRDSVTHFYNPSAILQTRLYEYSSACVRNFATTVREWFGQELSEYELHIMPLSFIDVPDNVQGLVLNVDEKRFLSYLTSLDCDSADPDSPYSVSINVEVKFTRSKSQEALPVRITKDPSAPEFRLSEEDIRERYPWDYNTLSEKCKGRFSDFKMNQEYHKIRKGLEKDMAFASIRYLHPGNQNSSKKIFYNPNILREMDKHYKRNS